MGRGELGSVCGRGSLLGPGRLIHFMEMKLHHRLFLASGMVCDFGAALGFTGEEGRCREAGEDLGDEASNSRLAVQHDAAEEGEE